MWAAIDQSRFQAARFTCHVFGVPCQSRSARTTASNGFRYHQVHFYSRRYASSIARNAPSSYSVSAEKARRYHGRLDFRLDVQCGRINGGVGVAGLLGGGETKKSDM